MKTVNRFVAWMCLFSTTFMGCYTTSYIQSTGDGRRRIEKGEITRVEMKDGTEYEFEKPAIVVEEAIIGIVEIKQSDGEHRGERVSLPITDVAEVHLSEFDAVVSVALFVTFVAVIVVGGTVMEEVADGPYH